MSVLSLMMGLLLLRYGKKWYGYVKGWKNAKLYS